MTVRTHAPDRETNLRIKNLSVNKDVRNICATRAHGNYTENAPIFSLLLLATDACGVVPKLYVDILGGFFFFGRILHMMGLWANDGSTVGRMGGAFCTMVSLIIGSVLVIYSAVQLKGGLSVISTKLVVIGLMIVCGKMFAGITVGK